MSNGANDLNAFVKEAVSHGKAQRLTFQAPRNFRVEAAAGTPIDFCSLWPTIKEGLEILKQILPIWAKWLVTALEAIGDGICGK